MELAEAYNLINGPAHNVGRFYGPAAGFDLGAGLILQNVAFPLYSVAEQDFEIVEGLVYILSHECDIDQANERPYSDLATLCPIIPLEAAFEKYLERRSSNEAGAFFGNVGKRLVERITYIPAIAEHLPYGGLLYFGMLSHTHVDELSNERVLRCAAVSMYGLQSIDAALQQAFAKPKAQASPLVGDLRRWRRQD
jgi:hypothetical protein